MYFICIKVHMEKIDKPNDFVKVVHLDKFFCLLLI